MKSRKFDTRTRFAGHKLRRRELIGGLLVTGFALPALSAVRGDEAMYIGGTLASIPDRTEGRLDLTDSKVAKFTSKKGEFSFEFGKVTSLEYGQKAGRRVGVAIAVNPLFLFSKKRKHFLTIGFTDGQDVQQGAVIEVGKKRIRSIITVLETRSGKAVEYESEEARKHVGN